MDAHDEVMLTLAILALIGTALFVVMRTSWFRRMTAVSDRRRHHVRRRRRPKFRRAA